MLNPIYSPLSAIRRLVALSSVCCLAWVPAAAEAGPLIAWTDTDPEAYNAVHLSDGEQNWSVQWSQTVATHDVTLDAIIQAFPRETPTRSAWYVTTRIGAGTMPADVVASGTYLPTLWTGSYDYNVDHRVILGTNLAFAAGTYYLVLEGPTSPGIDDWIGGAGEVSLAPGFAVGSYYQTTHPTSFAPAATFAKFDGAQNYVFELSTAAVPEPLTWAMMLGGFGLVGAAMRRRRADTAIA